MAALTKNLADELGPHGVNVTVVHPGLTRTENVAAMVQKRVDEGASVEETERAMANNILGRIVTPDEVAAVIAFLASPRSVAITGGAVDVGGGTPGVVTY